MYKQVFDYNGKPFLVKASDDGVLDEDDLKSQNLYQYTEVMPPSDLYPPRQFDGENWHGASAQQYEDANQPPNIEPNQVEITIGKLLTQLTEKNMINPSVEEIKYFFDKKAVTKDDLRKFRENNTLNEEQYKEITGEDYKEGLGH